MESHWLTQLGASIDTSSHVYKWNGEKFVLFQSMPSKWGYDIGDFAIGDTSFLTLADHAQESVIYRWSGTGFEEFQTFSPEGGGRCFKAVRVGNDTYLIFTNLGHDSVVYRWTGETFVEVQRLEGKAGRSVSTFDYNDAIYLLRTNFISGPREAPITVQESVLYRWSRERFDEVETYQTFGGTQSTPFLADGKTYIAVSNSLNAEVRFRTDSIIYAT